MDEGFVILKQVQEKHCDHFLKKYGELQQILKIRPDSEVERLAHEMMEHFYELLLARQAVIGGVTKELTASYKKNIPTSVIDTISAKIANEQYLVWASEKSIHDDPNPTNRHTSLILDSLELVLTIVNY